MEGMRAIVTEKENRPVLEKFVRFSLAMVLLPIATFFGIYWSLDTEENRGLLQKVGLPENSHGAMTVAALSAVLVVNIIMIAFVIMALAEDFGHVPGPAVGTQSESVVTSAQGSSVKPEISSAVSQGDTSKPLDAEGEEATETAKEAKKTN